MAALSEAYQSVNELANRQDPYENPQSFQRIIPEVEHPKPARHILGLVGGNEVSLTKSNWIDVESDLQGITRPNTDCPAREHLPLSGTRIVRKNPKNTITINTQMDDLPVAQFWAYPSVVGPQPLKTEVCVRPEKY